MEPVILQEQFWQWNRTNNKFTHKKIINEPNAR